MARKTYKSQLLSKKELTPTVRELTLGAISPEPMSFESGQFLTLHVPNQIPEKPPVKRAYSIASNALSPEILQLVIKLVPGGVASEYVKNFEVGKELEFSGPFGKLTYQPPTSEQIIFVCTGAGISQHLSFLRTHFFSSYLSAEGTPVENREQPSDLKIASGDNSIVGSASQSTEGPALYKTEDALVEGSHVTQISNMNQRLDIHLLFGVWNEDEIFYRKEIEEISSQLPNFTYEYVLDHSLFDGTEKAWPGKLGYVTDHFSKIDYQKRPTTFFLCGNPDMIKSVKAKLAEENFPKERIFAEAFN